MIGAAMLLAADLRAAMWAGVEHRLEIALAVTGEQDVAAFPTERVTKSPGLASSELLAEIEPAFVEYLGALQLQNGGIDEGLRETLKIFLDSSIRSAVFIGPIASSECLS